MSFQHSRLLWQAFWMHLVQLSLAYLLPEAVTSLYSMVLHGLSDHSAGVCPVYPPALFPGNCIPMLLNSLLITVLLQQTGFLGVCVLVFFVCLWDCLDWPGTWYIDKAAFKFMAVFMPLPLKCCNNRYQLPYLDWIWVFFTFVVMDVASSMCLLEVTVVFILVWW